MINKALLIGLTGGMLLCCSCGSKSTISQQAVVVPKTQVVTEKLEQSSKSSTVDSTIKTTAETSIPSIEPTPTEQTLTPTKPIATLQTIVEEAPLVTEKAVVQQIKTPTSTAASSVSAKPTIKPTTKPTTEAAQTSEPVSTEIAEVKDEVFSGVLIDEDCHDFPNPPQHDLPCMLMYSCRDSGYGIDILQADGSYKFYMLDSYGQELAWEYLNNTTNMAELYVTVTGTYEDGVIKVKTFEED